MEDGVNHMPGMSPIGREGLWLYRGESKACYKCDARNRLSVNMQSGKVFQCGAQGIAVLSGKEVLG